MSILEQILAAGMVAGMSIASINSHDTKADRILINNVADTRLHLFETYEDLLGKDLSREKEAVIRVKRNAPLILDEAATMNIEDTTQHEKILAWMKSLPARLFSE